MLFQKLGKFLDSLRILNQIYYSLCHSQSIRFRHQVEILWCVHYKFTPECKHLLCLNYFTHILCMCMCHSQRFNFIVKQSGNNSQYIYIYTYIIYDVKINYSLTHMKYMSLLFLYSVCVKNESVMFCDLKMQLMVLKHITTKNEWWIKTIKYPWTRKMAKQAL